MVAATIFVVGRLAEKRALGEREAFNWFDEDDTDTRNAIDMVDAIIEYDGGFGGDVFEARRWMEVRARGLLLTNWHALEAIAAELQKRKRLKGEEVADICRREGVKRQGELSKDEVLAKLTPQGRRNLLGELGRDGKRIIKR